MWHESRKQEKKVKGMLIDYQKRAERRKDHYEKMKSDPLQLLRITGTTCKLHLNPSVSNNEYSVLVPWQGNSDVMMSRFDGLAHLDYITEHSKSAHSSRDSELESKCDYERYRQLVYNKFKGISQETALAEININELYPISKPTHHEKKSSNKTAIGYHYDKSMPMEISSIQAVDNTPDSPDDNYEEDILSEIGNDLDLDVLETKQIDSLNGIATQFGIKAKPFSNYHRGDLAEHKLHNKELYLEKQKALTKSKGGTRRERRALKMELRSRLAPETRFRSSSPLSYACRASPTYPPSRPHWDRSASSSSAESGKIEYITEFGSGHDNKSKKRTKQHVKRSRRSRSHSSTRNKRSISRDRYRGRHRRHKRYTSSSSRSRTRSRSRERRSYHYKAKREVKYSPDSSSSDSDPVRRNSNTAGLTSPNVKKIDKVNDQPKMTHFEQMQLKMQNKISKHCKQLIFVLLSFE
ncbi:hypothetical protein LOD99_1221 [Oopsacas minuta]|uniref:Suppressor of white apricot N-terminal domain-containing protein n=1 Tax=Oopsacas minuta TaxID=111878 RepID=A0AAV7K6X4_9METZ|nr:hypothetical protein LOD99_1221 [Oopsacas minuta]